MLKGDPAPHDTLSSLPTVTQVLSRLDLAIAKAFTEGIRTDEVNSISQQYSPNK